MRHLPVFLVFLLAGSLPAEERLPNLAPRAEISSDSFYSADYAPRNVADGKIPDSGSSRDTGEAWCVRGDTHRNGARLDFAWPEPVRIAEVVYYGRTAWQDVENWKDYEVRLDGVDVPVAKGTLKKGHGPQRIKIPEPRSTQRLSLVFTSSYGGSNPGASEVRVFSEPPPDKQLGVFFPLPGPAPDAADYAIEDSPELRADLESGRLGFRQLLVIRRHAINPTHVYTYHAEGLTPGGGLFLFTPGAKESAWKELVASPEGILLDADLSYDGKTILFSWRRTMRDFFQIFEIDVSGSGLRQITDHASNNFNVCRLPDGGMAFLSDRKPAFAYCWVTTSPTLYRSDARGQEVVRLSANYLNDFTPSVMRDGRIIYSRWEYVDRPAIPIQSLWTINQNGTGLAGYFGNRVLSPATFMEAREIPGRPGQTLCVLTSHNGPCRGAIGIIDPSLGANAQEAIRNLTPEVPVGRVGDGNGNNVRGPYESPYPVDENLFLVSRLGTVLLRDYDGVRQAILARPEGALGHYSPQPVRAEPVPPSHPSRAADPGETWATVLLQNVYLGLEPTIKRGEVKRIAVVQEIEKSRVASLDRRAFGFQFPVVSCGATYSPKKVWGFAEVEEDGSAHFKVPAGVPIYFMALDAEGRAVQRMRTFTHLMPGESQNCVGCHTDRNSLAPDFKNRPAAALMPPRELEPPDWGVTGFSYAHVVQPVLDRHCVRCHSPRETGGGVDLSGDRTDFFNVSYETLARQGAPGQNPYTKWIPTFNGHEANILQVTPKYWGSPASKLADLVLNGHPDKEGKAQVDVPPAERRKIFTWIDLDVPYYGTSESSHPDLQGCRQLMPAGLDAALKDVAARRCASCHQGGNIPRKEWTRVSNPEHNAFLLAPLSRDAGGAGKCGTPVFQTVDDPDYQAILKTFEPVTELVRAKPREDMVP